MYSQNKEEQVILEYFGDRIGTFISFGENDGETFSNVRALALKGWKGVLIEPSPKAFNRLENLYSDKKGKFYLYNVAIGTTNGKTILHESGELVKRGDVALVSTIVPEEKKRFQGVTPYEEVEVSVFRWKTFQNRLSIKDFDFISADVEGLEIEILEQMDLSKTSLICVETNGNLAKKAVLDAMLPDFKVIYTSPENLIYAR